MLLSSIPENCHLILHASNLPLPALLDRDSWTTNHIRVMLKYLLFTLPKKSPCGNSVNVCCGLNLSLVLILQTSLILIFVCHFIIIIIYSLLIIWNKGK